MKATRSILLIAAILLPHLANAHHTLTLLCMQMEPILVSPSCSGLCDGSIELSVTGGQSPYTYLWNTADTTQDLFNICAGEYLVTVTDANGCTVESNSIIIDPVPVAAVATGTDVSCFGLCDGSFDTDILGGPFGGPWDFFTLNYAVDLSALCAGEYVDVLTAFDFGGCPTVFTIIINSPEPLDGDAYTNPSSCANTCDGSVELEVFGGTPPYSSTFFPGLCEGLYSIIVLDAAGCLLQFDMFVPSLQGGPLIDDILVNDATNGQADGSLTIIASGACPPFSYSINNGPFQASNIFTGLPAGVYLVSIKDGCGCIIEMEVTIQNLTSVNELKANFNLYPNPVNTYLHVESVLPFSIELLNIQGKMIRHADKANSHYLNVEDIVPGLYLLRIYDGSGVVCRRVIVQ